MYIKRKSALRDGRPNRAYGKNNHTYNSTTFRKAQAIKKRRREMVMEFAALPVVLAVFAGLFWIMWSLRGVV